MIKQWPPFSARVTATAFPAWHATNSSTQSRDDNLLACKLGTILLGDALALQLLQLVALDGRKALQLERRLAFHALALLHEGVLLALLDDTLLFDLLLNGMHNRKKTGDSDEQRLTSQLFDQLS